MKIAMFTDSYKPQINGVVTSIEAFTKELRRKKHEVRIFAPAIPDYTERDKFVHRFKSVEFWAYPEYRIGMPVSLLYRRMFDKVSFDLVHIHSPFSMGLTGLAVAKVYKLPTVGTFHTMFPEYTHYFRMDRLQKIKSINKILKKGIWKYLSWFYNRCDCVIAPTEEVKRELKRHGLKKEIHVIPSGMRIRKKRHSKNKLREKYGFQKNDKILLHVGRIGKEKNIELILKVMKKILKKTNAKLLITSDGPYKTFLEEKMKKLGLGKNVVFTGYVSKKKLSELYTLSDIFIMASNTETQGMVLLEALNHGLPLVVVKAPVTGTFVKENGVGIVAKKNLTDLSKAILKILNMEKNEKRKLQKNARKTLEKYDIRKLANDLIGVYDKLLEEKVNTPV
jgi:glycosyltransferase involved in cell wall biosynthesis